MVIFIKTSRYIVILEIKFSNRERAMWYIENKNLLLKYHHGERREKYLKQFGHLLNHLLALCFRVFYWPQRILQNFQYVCRNTSSLNLLQNSFPSLCRIILTNNKWKIALGTSDYFDNCHCSGWPTKSYALKGLLLNLLKMQN